MENIAIIGAGSFGTAIAAVLANNGHKLRLYVRAPDILNIIKSDGMNQTYLPGYNLNLENIHLTDNILDAAKEVKYLIITVPAQSVMEIMTKLKPAINNETIIILTSKGIIDGAELSSKIKSEVTDNKICGLYGVTFAELIAGGEGFSSMCVASDYEDTAADIANLFASKQNNRFRVYISKDLKGAEFGGAMKNVYAIAMGLYDGYLEFVQKKASYNKSPKGTKIILSRHSLLNLCIMEFIELGLAHGVKLYTLLGPSGIGDVVACGSENNTSRNYQYGRWKALLEFKESLLDASDQIRYQYLRAPSLHEGYDTVKSAKIMADRYRIRTPIIDAVYEILYNKAKIQKTIPPLIDKLSIIVDSKKESDFYQQVCNSINS